MFQNSYLMKCYNIAKAMNSCSLLLVIFTLLSFSIRANEDASYDSPFRRDVMNAKPYYPKYLSNDWPACAPRVQPNMQPYFSIDKSGLSQGWEKRVASNWNAFDIPKSQGYITVIDFAQNDGVLKFRYLANDHTQNQLYEPWSSSKIMPYVATLAALKLKKVPPDFRVGNTKLADLITSIHTYEQSGLADGNSNAIATWFANVVGRESLTALFHESWLNLNNAHLNKVRFRGAYGPTAFKPDTTTLVSDQLKLFIPVKAFPEAQSDPFYQTYRCDSCGTDGNKPMTTLAQAEFLKRLVSQKRSSIGSMPGLSDEAVISLLYAPGNDRNANPVGGMMSGISRMLHIALARALSPKDTRSPKVVLDELTDGNWRIFQKIGWGPSETRGMGENVLLAHVCLPREKKMREFTLAARTEAPGTTEAAVDEAGLKMQQLLIKSLRALLSREPRR